MTLSKAKRYPLFALLYFTQGTVLGYFTALNALYLLSRDVSLTKIGIFATIALIPFVIKILFGILSDKINLFGLGHRKPYILLGLAIQFICLILVPQVDPAASYWGFVALAFTLQMGMALYDTCTDGLALDTTPEHEKGLIQGLMVGGRAVGVMVAAMVAGLLAEKVSWPAVFYLLAGLTLLPLPLVLLMREPEKRAGQAFEWRSFRAFNNRTVLAVAGAGFVFFLIVVGANQLVNPYLTERFEISLATAGSFTTLWGAGVVLGGLAGGLLMDKLGRRPATWAALGMSVIGVLALALIPNLPLAWGVVFLFGLTYGSVQAIYYALAMFYTEPRIAASMFSILMAVTNIGQGVGLSLAGRLADTRGYATAFVVLAALNVLVVPFVLLIFARRKQAAGAA